MEFIPNVEFSGRGGQPKNVVMLTADAFGVLPPISRLTPGAGDVPLPLRLHRAGGRDRKRPGRRAAGNLPTCFGSPFLPRHPEVYGRCWPTSSPGTAPNAGW